MTVSADISELDGSRPELDDATLLGLPLNWRAPPLAGWYLFFLRRIL